MTKNTTAIVIAADRVVTEYAAAITGFTALGRATVEAPPTIEAGLAAVAQLTTARPELDNAITGLLRSLIDGGITEQKLARVLNLRGSSLTARLTTKPTPAVAVTVPEGAIRYRDLVSTRAARESLIAAARDLGAAHAGALRPLSTVSQGTLPEPAVLDAALAALVHLHRARRQLAAALDRVLATLVLGGVMRRALVELLGVSAPTLRRRLADQPLARARHVDLVDEGTGRWTVTPAAVGRYAPPEVDPALLTEVLDGVVARYGEVGPSVRAREKGTTVLASGTETHDGRSAGIEDGVSVEGGA